METTGKSLLTVLLPQYSPSAVEITLVKTEQESDKIHAMSFSVNRHGKLNIFPSPSEVIYVKFNEYTEQGNESI